MLGFRGASRYLAADFRACFELECAALRKVRNDLGSPCRAEGAFSCGPGRGARRGEAARGNACSRQGRLRLVDVASCPPIRPGGGIPAVLRRLFRRSNDLTQLTLGLDRDSGLVAAGFDERDGAVKPCCRWRFAPAASRKVVGICGQARPTTPISRVADGAGHDSLSLNPDTVYRPGYSQRRCSNPSSPAAIPSRAPTPLIVLELALASAIWILTRPGRNADRVE